MTLEFKPLNPQEFDDFNSHFKGAKTFLQSYAYGQFRAKVGEKILYYGIFENQNLVGAALIQKVKTRFKTFLHTPHGPLIEDENKKHWSFFLQSYEALGRGEGCDFVRVSPLLVDKKDNKEAFKSCGFRSAPVHLVNPEMTWVLDITQDEDVILAGMKKSTRYEVRRIEKTGIKVQKGNRESDLENFWTLHKATVGRHNFTPFPKANTALQLKIWKEDCQIFSSSFEQKIYSSCVILFDKESAYYHQGASLPHKFPVAHAPLWEAILEAKRRGCKHFNFWGIVREDQKNHPWWGLSRFKRGWGGAEQVFLHAQDKPLTSKYWLNFLLEVYRKWKKGY